MTRIALLALLTACHAAPRPVAPAAFQAELVFSATQTYGVQPDGQDTGTLYAFVKVDASPGAGVGVAEIVLRHGEINCAHAHAVDLAIVEPVAGRGMSFSDRDLTLDALAAGAKLDGTFPTGTTYVRIRAELDHVCGGEAKLPDVAIWLDDGDWLVRPVDAALPS